MCLHSVYTLVDAVNDIFCCKCIFLIHCVFSTDLLRKRILLSMGRNSNDEILSAVLSSIKQSLVVYFDLFGVLLMVQVMLEFNHCNFPCCADLSSVDVENLTAVKMVYQKKPLHSNSNKTKGKMKRQQVVCLLG